MNKTSKDEEQKRGAHSRRTSVAPLLFPSLGASQGSHHAGFPLIHDHNAVRQMSPQSSTALSQEISEGFFWLHKSSPELSHAGREGGREEIRLPPCPSASPVGLPQHCWEYPGALCNLQRRFFMQPGKAASIIALPLFVAHNRAHDLLSSAGSPRCYVLYCCDDENRVVHRTGSPAALSSVNHCSKCTLGTNH